MVTDEYKQDKFKSVKQRLSNQQKILKIVLDEGCLPRDKDVAEFAAISREMKRLCVPEWLAAMDVYMNRLEKFQAAAANGNPQIAHNRFKALLDCKISCHKDFR